MNETNQTSDFFGDSDSATFYKALLDDMVTFVAVLDREGNILFVNNTPLNVAGITLEQIKGSKFWDAAWWSYSEQARQSIRDDVALCLSGQSLIHEIQLATANGSLMWIEYSMHPVFDENGEVVYLVPEGRDVTDRKQQERLLRHRQKMEALDTLTGGIAHDFNNILGIISGYTELLSRHLRGQPILSRYLEDIQKATKRGSQLTRKLLSFAQIKPQSLSTCYVNQLIDDLRLLIEKTLTSKIQVSYKLSPSLPHVEIDSGDFEDAIINICINALHAMEEGGKLIIETSQQRLDADAAKKLELTEGDYVVLSIEDTGCGMDQKTLEKVMVPFFTTKGENGTGLGMSQVFGFVKRSAGKLQLFSEVNQGTRVVIHLPVCDTPQCTQPSSELQKLQQDGDRMNATLLLVDDEQAMTAIASEMLAEAGYRVLTANHAEEALELLERHRVDMVITDIVMPGMDGYGLASEIGKRHPETLVQFVSGYEKRQGEEVKGETEGDVFTDQTIIYKPYTSQQLLERVAWRLRTAAKADRAR